MTTKELYKKYNLPPNLQKHLLRVASIAQTVCKSWHGPNVNRDIIIQTCLLHDLANIIKADYDNHPDFLEEEIANINYWKRIKRDLISRYGNDEHIAVETICQEIGIRKEIISLLKKTRFKYLIKILNSNDWHSKIIKYSDMRIGPFGILSVSERMQEAEDRYQKYHRSNQESPSKKELIDAAYKLEKIITENVGIDLEKISDNDLEKDFAKLLALEIR